MASSDQTVRANAALLLGKSGKQEGIRFLYWTLQRNDSSDKVVLQAAEAIAMLRRSRESTRKLWTRLISTYADDRVIGIRAMGALGTEEAKNAHRHDAGRPGPGGPPGGRRAAWQAR